MIIDRNNIKEVIENEKNNNKRVVFTNGCFDILHTGHIEILKKSRTFGDCLIVGLNSDKSIRSIKGEDRPILDFVSRSNVLDAVRYVDYVVGFDEDTPENLINEVKPDVLVKGGDYSEDSIVGSSFVKSYGGTVKTIKLVDGYSTSKIVEKILNTNKDKN